MLHFPCVCFGGNYERVCKGILILIRVFLEPRSSVSARVEMCVVSQQECADLILAPRTIHHTRCTTQCVVHTMYSIQYMVSFHHMPHMTLLIWAKYLHCSIKEHTLIITY